MAHRTGQTVPFAPIAPSTSSALQALRDTFLATDTISPCSMHQDFCWPVNLQQVNQLPAQTVFYLFNFIQTLNDIFWL